MAVWHKNIEKLFLRSIAIIIKGQLISKYLLGVVSFFQKTNENKSTWVKLNSFVRFLEETSAWKNHFEFVWPLVFKIGTIKIKKLCKSK